MTAEGSYSASVNAMYDFDESLNINMDEKELQAKENALLQMKEKYQHRQSVLYCTLGYTDNGESCLNSFTPVLTNKGICFAFNSNEFANTLTDITYNQYFKSIFNANTVPPISNTKLASGFKMF